MFRSNEHKNKMKSHPIQIENGENTLRIVISGHKNELANFVSHV
jgi:hypothetical protein